MRKKKLYSRLLCLGFIWGILSWILVYNYMIVDSSNLYTIPVFLSEKIHMNLLMPISNQEMHLLAFLLTLLIGGMIGYVIAFIIYTVFKDHYEEDNRCLK